MSASATVELEAIVAHVCLPPKLPFKRERFLDQIEEALASYVSDACRTLRDQLSGHLSYTWGSVRSAVQTCIHANHGRSIDRTRFLMALETLDTFSPLILHITAQNAGILISKRHDSKRDEDMIVFEAFEASPQAQQVMEADNALQWDFPGVVVAMPLTTFHDPEFQNNLADFLQQASTESITLFAARASKEGATVPEPRDTVDPSIICQMLMTLIEAVGYRMEPDLLRKRIRDDVCWDEGAGSCPWRRSPFWLVLRVSLARHLASIHGAEIGRVYYKFLLCVVLAHILADAVSSGIYHESIIVLNTKLCRRLAKLEDNRLKASSKAGEIYGMLFEQLRFFFEGTIENANAYVFNLWDRHKRSILRRIPLLPPRSQERDLILTLPNSFSYLNQLRFSAARFDTISTITHQSNALHTPVMQAAFRKFAQHYYSLADIEDSAGLYLKVDDGDYERACIKFARSIASYMDAVRDTYNHHPEQKSVMLLTIMKLWTLMDQCAVKAFNLLGKYDPGIPPAILNVLQIGDEKGLIDLQTVQRYLEERKSNCQYNGHTIFDDPREGCFAEQYFLRSKDSEMLQSIYKRIQTATEKAREKKREQWLSLSAEYDSLQREIASASCVYTYTEEGYQPIHDSRNCKKCFLERKAGRMRISLHEDPLPVDPSQARAVVFELNCPEAFSAYRNTTWMIIRSLAVSEPIKSQPPKLLLREYSEVKPFISSTSIEGVCLASISKSRLTMHFNQATLPARWDDVCVHNTLRLRYFDTKTESWTGRGRERLSFAHHCALAIPSDSPFAPLLESPKFALDTAGPSSYEIIASQTNCPPGLGVHEFMAFQSLLCGTVQRWPTILLELGSSNLNLSTEATSILISQLTLLAGPPRPNDHLRSTHSILRDPTFCSKLLEEINKRLDGISSSWREVNCMLMLLVILLRLCSVAHNVAYEAFDLLLKAQRVTSGWVRTLRQEIRDCTDAASSPTFSKYALWAALLCRKTFAVYADPAHSGRDIGPTELQNYIESSIMLHETLPSNLSSLPRTLRNALISDTKAIYRLRRVLKLAFQSSPHALSSFIQNIWPSAENSMAAAYSQPVFLNDPDEWWMEWTMHATRELNAQLMQYHILEGYLLVDGQPLGKLPPKYQQCIILKKLFGDQSLPAYPSSMPGMTYMLPFAINGHYIHFGFRQNELIVRAHWKGTVLELVPSSVFRGHSTSDLPVLLIDNCCHWLDIQTGVLEIRTQPHIWMSRHSNWKIDINTRQAIRRNSRLVDPHSDLFRQITGVFRFFEHPEQIIVYQPKKAHLSVELRRMDLSFYVNKGGFLYSSQLRCGIDRNQDAGTWYGLRSMLVLRDGANKGQRSIIAPMGAIRYKLDGCHVQLYVENDGSYGRFVINDLLGRIDCPAEPRLAYCKAMFHAYTSFALPDPLTGTTGTEEALRFLRSGFCQPWIPINSGPQSILQYIARLSPRREYYPPHLAIMQRIYWDKDLTVTMQHEEYSTLVSLICEKSRTLSMFALEKHCELLVEIPETPHKLHERSVWRRQQYQRPIGDIETKNALADLVYTSRDRPRASIARTKVYEMSIIIHDWFPEVYGTVNLAHVLQERPVIVGFEKPFHRGSLSDLLSIDVCAQWGPLAALCRMSSKNEKFKLMFIFAIISFGDNAIPTQLLQSLILFAMSDKLKMLKPPAVSEYTRFVPDQYPTTDLLQQLIRPFCTPYPPDERAEFPGQIASKMRRKLEEKERKYNLQVEKDCETLIKHIQSQWPCPTPSATELASDLLVDIPSAIEHIRPEWLRLYENLQLSDYLSQVKVILDCSQRDRRIGLPAVTSSSDPAPRVLIRYSGIPTLSKDLMRKPGPSTTGHGAQSRHSNANADTFHSQLISLDFSESTNRSQTVDRGIQADSTERHQLDTIIHQFTASPSALERKYGEDLLKSLEALNKVKRTIPREKALPGSIGFSSEIHSTRQAIIHAFNNISVALEQDEVQAKWLKLGNLWPCITPITLLEQLRSTSAPQFGPRMKEILVEYAIAITGLQQLMRIEQDYHNKDAARFWAELHNQGHTNWRPEEHLNWLLLEIDCNILIRAEQVDVAHAMMSPTSGSNSALQMNMGQGKTSCIIPMIASELANSTQLVRVIVPKALLLQTAQLLQTRLGGLLGRYVSHVPFARKTPTTQRNIEAYWKIHRDIKISSGVIIALPEHLLSFKLSGLQRLSDKRNSEAAKMLQIYQWKQDNCRDILDECDYTLSTRTQLIYPTGTQAAVDGHPYRWEVAETLLHACHGYLWSIAKDYPQSIEVVERSGDSFPLVFFLRRDAEESLISRLIGDILNGQILLLPVRGCSAAELTTIRQFISTENVGPGVLKEVKGLFNDNLTARKTLYLLRGLLVHRILLLSFKKRWNVQYGIHPKRDPIAVPFHSKGVPSEQAEWGHPDVAILLTCLSFYFGGLEIRQLRQGLEHLLKTDDPASGYDRWTHNCAQLPDSLREWNVLNVDDQLQLAELWKHFRYNVVVIDYYLNHFVFPAHAKQFRIKLQTSGWDLPIFSVQGQGARSTGFSGTNDNRSMLPLTIKQDDLPGLRHTNAEVLSYLLMPRNRSYEVAADAGRRFTEKELLQMLCSKGIRMLIDAGAQILELDNRSLVSTWLSIDHQAPAALYFNDQNKPYILHRGGSEVPLVASTFANNLGDCLVYLDEAHTRGTDLPMPAHTLGALTLGMGQTKDHTVQAAMRLRQLGTTQSILWVAPPEIHQSILDLQSKREGDSIDSYDVICWLLKQTCIGIEQLQPLYFSQGMDFCRRIEAAVLNKDYITDNKQKQAYLDVLRTPEQQALEELYGPKLCVKLSRRYKSDVPRVNTLLQELRKQRKQFQDFGNAVSGLALQEVEQEREIAFEVESVRQVRKPVSYTPLAFPGIDKDILGFVHTGVAASRSTAWEDAHVALRLTDLGQKMGVSGAPFTGRLLVSREYMRTISVPTGRRNDSFLRPLNWLLWSTVTNTAIVVIPEEIEIILPILLEKQQSNTYLIAYAAPVTRRMSQFNGLKYFSVPPLPKYWTAPTWLTIELGILSGRLYFDFKEYNELCKFLGAKSWGGDSKSFTEKPLLFLHQWLSIRRKGQDFTHTPVGYICQGKILTSDHPFFRSDAGNMLKGRESSEKRLCRAMTEELLEASASDFEDDELEWDEGSSPDEYIDKSDNGVGED